MVKQILSDPIFWSNIINMVLVAVLPLLITALYSALMAVIKYFKARTNNKFIGLAFDTLGTVVTDLYETERKEIEKALADGKIDETEKKRLLSLLKDRAIELCMSRLGPEVTKALNDSFVDIQKVMESKVEELVARMKSSVGK